MFVLEIYFYGKEILACHLFFSMLLRPYVPYANVIRNTTKICILRSLFYFYIFIFYISFSCTFDLTFDLHLLAKIIDFVLNRCLIYCQWTDRKHFQNPCLVALKFHWHLHVSKRDMSHQHIKIDFILQPATCRWQI